MLYGTIVGPQFLQLELGSTFKPTLNDESFGTILPFPMLFSFIGTIPN